MLNAELILSLPSLQQFTGFILHSTTFDVTLACRVLWHLTGSSHISIPIFPALLLLTRLQPTALPFMGRAVFPHHRNMALALFSTALPKLFTDSHPARINQLESSFHRLSSLSLFYLLSQPFVSFSCIKCIATCDWTCAPAWAGRKQ